MAALIKAVAVSVHLQDVNVVGKPVQQCASQPFGAEDFGPFLEGQVAGAGRDNSALIEKDKAAHPHD